VSSRKRLRPPKRVTLAFVHRETGGIHKRKTFEFRNEFQAVLKIAAWVTGMMQEGYTPKRYRLIAYIPEDSEEPSFVVGVLERSGIEIYRGTISPTDGGTVDPAAGVLMPWRGTRTQSS
jgi:hypothetical protein